MATVVLDATNIDAIVADAAPKGMELAPSAAEPAKPAEATQKAAEPKADEAPAKAAEDETEDENGLTAAERKDLTEKMQRAIGKKHRALKDAEEFAAEQYNEKRLAEQRAESLQREIERLKVQPTKAEPDAEKPDRKNFATDEAYRDAVDDWRVDQKFKERAAEEAKTREAERIAKVMEVAKSRIAHAIEIVPDFQEVTEAVDMEVPGYIAGYMQESDMFAELGYHFAKHPQELARLSAMPAAKALVEVGKIESKLTPFAPVAKVEKTDEKSESKSNGTTPSPEKTAAKPSTETGTSPSKPRVSAPIKPLSSGSAVQVEKDEREMTAQEALQAWSKRKGLNMTRRQRH